MQTSEPLQVLLDALAGHVDDSPPRLDAAGWSCLVAEASRHGVCALANLGLARCEAVPPDVAHSLGSHYLKNRLRNLRLYAHLGTLLERLCAESIAVVVLKGAYLAQAVYRDPALRAMADADVLVRESDLERAAQALRSMGWQQAVSVRASGHQLPAFELDGVQVELHWNIEDDGSPFAVDVAGLWERAMPAHIGRARALALSCTDLLLHLCMHTAYGHGWKQFDGGLRHLADIAAVVRLHDSALDWHDVLLRAEAWHAERCVALCLITARDLLRAPVPQAVLDRLTLPNARWVRVARELCLGGHYAELARCLPVRARSWVDKRWQRLTRGARWREFLLPAPASLRHVYPTLQARASLLLLAHWKDLAGDLLRTVFDARVRALLLRERERRALIAWLEGATTEYEVSSRSGSAADHRAIPQASDHR